LREKSEGRYRSEKELEGERESLRKRRWNFGAEGEMKIMRVKS
jgi:hypothetical protein